MKACVLLCLRTLQQLFLPLDGAAARFLTQAGVCVLEGLGSRLMYPLQGLGSSFAHKYCTIDKRPAEWGNRIMHIVLLDGAMLP